MIGDRAASRPLCQSPVNVIVIPLITCSTLLMSVAPPAGKISQYPFNTLHILSSGCMDQEKIPPTESGNGKQGSNVM